MIDRAEVPDAASSTRRWAGPWPGRARCA